LDKEISIKRYLLIVFLLTVFACEDKDDDYYHWSPFNAGHFTTGLKYTKYDLLFDESQDKEYTSGYNEYAVKSAIYYKEDGGSFYRIRARGDHYNGLPFTFPNGTTVQLNFHDYELTDHGSWLSDLDHSCTEEMWDGDSFTFAFFDPVFLTDKEKKDIELLYDTEPGTEPDWEPGN
tara:strand:- start:56 stop:583 length:528 start_codon:yes stop_codon:yes gene_type:complete